MIKKTLFTLLVLIIAVICFLVFVYADKVDADFNPTSLEKPYQYSPEAKAMYESLDFIADLHCDVLMWQRDITKSSSFGHVDIPRMQEANIALQAFTMVTKSPSGMNIHQNDSDTDRITALVIGQGKPPSTWFSLAGRAIHQCKKLHKAAKKDSFFDVIESKQDLQKLINNKQSNKKYSGGILGIEGAHCLEGEMKNLKTLYDLGVRMLGPAHFFDTEVGGSAHGMKKEGLTPFGLEVIQFMQEKSMILDLAHSSDQLIDEVLEYDNFPIVNSHTGVNGTCDSPRNLSDDQIRKIASKGGLIGIGYFKLATCGDGVSDIVKAIKYVRNLVGAEYVVLGSDFDGSVSVPFDVTGLPMIVDQMIQEGFSENEIRLIMGENVRSFLLKWLPQE